jgi:hypothetical protein
MIHTFINVDVYGLDTFLKIVEELFCHDSPFLSVEDVCVPGHVPKFENVFLPKKTRTGICSVVENG